MEKREAVEEFYHILPAVLNEYGSDEDSVREEIWELYLDHLIQESRINRKQRDSWTLPLSFRKHPSSYKNIGSGEYVT